MSQLVRDTAFGHLVRFLTGGRAFQYAEEKDPSLWKRYLDREQTTNMAQFGHPVLTPEEQAEKVATAAKLENPESGTDSASLTPQNNSGEKQAQEQQLSSTITGQVIDPEKGRDTTIVTWFGDDDPEVRKERRAEPLLTLYANVFFQNPKNWSGLKKGFVTFEICFLTFSIYIGSAIYTAGIESVVMEFGVSQTKATLGLTLFVAGYGLGPLLWAPLQEIPQVEHYESGENRNFVLIASQIGRNPVYIGTLAIFVIFQVPTALSVNFAMLLCFRFLTGFFGSPALATGGATIGDMYAPKKMAYGIGLWGIGAVCGPVIGPLVGGFAAQAKDWTWTIWELMWLSGFALVRDLSCD